MENNELLYISESEVLCPPLDYKVCQNLMTPYRGGWCLSSTLLVHELRTFLYGANILELTLTCYVRDLAKPYITSW